ncbi:histone deacetylase [Bernardetia sp.]|uniref:histone deacetylase n=1 Tax=Bernardetia sp. TaxID=1937974 RepID=UPI0025BD95F3|nr:histone deacetylase [Bernardetia sp.]
MQLSNPSNMKVFYNKQQTVSSFIKNSPSAAKPKLVVQSWKNLGYPVEIMKVRPSSVDELCLAHNPSYVRGILKGQIKNGFDNKNKEIAKSLLWTTGSFVSAATYAYQHRESTFSPTSGFHHAHYDQAAGFCTFSGLTIAAILLNQRFGAKKIGILDLDSHSGDGTDQTLYKTGHENLVAHYSLGYHDVTIYNNEEWLNRLSDLICERFSTCEILFYQAGVDCHIDDPEVDRGQFTTEQIALRDKIVYKTCKELGLPVVTNLAGGYQKPIEKVVELHNLAAIAFNEVN